MTRPARRGRARDTAVGGTAENSKDHHAIEDFLLHLHRLASILGETTIFARHGIGLAEWALLKSLAVTPIPIRELRRRLNVSRQRTSTLLKDLQEKDLVVIERVENERRRQTVHLTQDAVATMRAISD